MTTSSEAGEAVRLTVCRGCHSADLHQVLDLGLQSACDHFPAADDPTPDARWPLGLVLCGRCGLVQLDHSSPAPEEPLAVESATLQRHAVEVTERILRHTGLPAGTTFHEFASHHGGSWAQALRDAGLVETDDPARLVLDNQSIIHAEDFDGELAQRVAALAPDGLLVIEFHHALEQLTQGQFDTVRHGHPLYFSLTAWRNALQRHGLDVVDAWPEDVFGGCLVVVAARAAGRGDAAGADPRAAELPAQVAEILRREHEAGVTDPERYRELDTLAARTTTAVREHLERARREGRRVVAYGAGSKAVTFLGVAGLGPDRLPMVADLSPGKQGRRVPGAGIPIVSPEALVAAEPDEVLVLTWDIAPEVMTQLRKMGLHATAFTVPLPTFTHLT